MSQNPKTKTETIELLKRRITEAGMTSSDFATKVLLRDGRTIRRWLSGESPIPHAVMDFLTSPWEVPWPGAEAKGNR